MKFDYFGIRGKVKLSNIILQKKITKMKNDNQWINHLIASYHYNPLLCSCGATMTLCYELSFFPGGTKDG